MYVIITKDNMTLHQKKCTLSLQIYPKTPAVISNANTMRSSAKNCKVKDHTLTAYHNILVSLIYNNFLKLDFNFYKLIRFCIIVPNK